MHAGSVELRTALVEAGADPSSLVDSDGNTLLHNAQTADEITALLRGPLTDVNATNKVKLYDSPTTLRREVFFSTTQTSSALNDFDMLIPAVVKIRAGCNRICSIFT